MKIIITEEQKKKLFIPRKLEDREEQLLKHINNVINSTNFQEDLENLIREWWPDISDFNEWLDENGWDLNYIDEYQYEDLGNEIFNYIEADHLVDFIYELLDFDKFVPKSELTIKKLKEIGYLE